MTAGGRHRRHQAQHENVAFDPDDIEQAVAEIERVHAQ